MTTYAPPPPVPERAKPPPPPPAGPPPPPPPGWTPQGPYTPYAPSWSYGAPAGYPPYAPYGPAFQLRPKSTVDGGAVGSLVTSLLGLITLVFCLGITGIVFGPIAFGLGISSLHRIEASEGKLRGRALGVAGMILGGMAGVGGFVFLLLTIAFVSYTLSHPAPQPS